MEAADPLKPAHGNPLTGKLPLLGFANPPVLHEKAVL